MLVFSASGKSVFIRWYSDINCNYFTSVRIILYDLFLPAMFLYILLLRNLQPAFFSKRSWTNSKKKYVFCWLHACLDTNRKWKVKWLWNIKSLYKPNEHMPLDDYPAARIMLFSYTIFTDTTRWLEVLIRCSSSPRFPRILISVGCMYFAANMPAVFGSSKSPEPKGNLPGLSIEMFKFK